MRGTKRILLVSMLAVTAGCYDAQRVETYCDGAEAAVSSITASVGGKIAWCSPCEYNRTYKCIMRAPNNKLYNIRCWYDGNNCEIHAAEAIK